MTTSPDRMVRHGADVELALDFICAGSYVGFTRLQQAAARRRAEGASVQITFQPVQLLPVMATDAGSHFDFHRSQLGEERARAIADDNTFGAGEGLRLDFRRARMTNTLKAHTLLVQATTQGRGEQAVERLFRAYFTQGLHLSDEATLDRLAADIGVDRTPEVQAQVHAALRAGRDLGLETTPQFRFADGSTLSGLPTVDDLHAALTASTAEP